MPVIYQEPELQSCTSLFHGMEILSEKGRGGESISMSEGYRLGKRQACPSLCFFFFSPPFFSLAMELQREKMLENPKKNQAAKVE